MKKKTGKKDIIKYSILFFLIFSVSYGAVYCFFQLGALASKREDLKENENRIISLERDTMSNELGDVIYDLLYLAEGVDLNNMVDSAYEETAQQWREFSDIKKNYGKILFVDTNLEVQVDVNYSETLSYISNGATINEAELICYSEASKLEKGQVYISKMDLNMDENAAVLASPEIPESPVPSSPEALNDPGGKARPTLRFATPLYNHKDGEVRGVVIVNYFPEDILSTFKLLARTSQGDVYLLDSNGYWIANNDAQKEWGFKYAGKNTINFAAEYPAEWTYMQLNDSGSIQTENGYFNFTHVIPAQNNIGKRAVNDVNVTLQNGDWTAVSFISKTNNNYTLFETNPVLLVVKFFRDQGWYYILILVISLITARLFVKNKKAREEVKYCSEYDGLTNVLNRRAGFERMHSLCDKIKKDGGKNCVCYVDINGLKEVNDTLGHLSGDELIKTVVTGMEKAIRQSDFIVRLGGDEFLLVLQNADAAEAEQVWQRVQTEYDKINTAENRPYLVSVSHGIEECSAALGNQMDTVILSADEKMYIEKRRIKKNLTIVNVRPRTT